MDESQNSINIPVVKILTKLDLTVKPYTSQTPVIVVHPPSQKYLCDPDSIEVYFEALGKFGEGNSFHIMKPDNSDQTLLTVKAAGSYKLPVSAFVNQPYSFIKVKATNPQIQGNAGLPIIIDTKPVLQNPGEFGGTT